MALAGARNQREGEVKAKGQKSESCCRQPKNTAILPRLKATSPHEHGTASNDLRGNQRIRFFLRCLVANSPIGNLNSG